MRDGTAPVSLFLTQPQRMPLTTSPAVVETASTVANQDTSQPNVLKRRSPGEVVVGEEHVTSVEMTAISPETVHLNPPAVVEIVSTVVSLVICRRTVPRKGSLGEVVDLVMGVERKVISRETVPARPVEGVVVVASIVVKTVISYVIPSHT